MKLCDNPFAVLGVSPADDRHTLINRADEEALLKGAAVDDALNSLMQMNKRISAELRWFPGTDPDTAAAFLAFEEKVSAGEAARLPSLDGLGSPLAQANALAAFFEVWPSTLPEYTVGLCCSLSMILNEVAVGEMLRIINQDREKGGWELIPDELTLAGPLEDRLRELSGIVEPHLRSFSSADDRKEILQKLHLSRDFDPRGNVGKAVLDFFILGIHDSEEKLRKPILDREEKLKEGTITRRDLEELKGKIIGWADLVSPMWKFPGTMYQEAKNIGMGMRECIVRYFNNAPTESRQMSKTIPVFNGTRTITLTYQSKKTAIMAALELSKWLSDLFQGISDLTEKLKKDQETLKDLLVKEEASAREALAKAK